MKTCFTEDIGEVLPKHPDVPVSAKGPFHRTRPRPSLLLWNSYDAASTCLEDAIELAERLPIVGDMLNGVAADNNVYAGIR